MHPIETIACSSMVKRDEVLRSVPGSDSELTVLRWKVSVHVEFVYNICHPYVSAGFDCKAFW